MYIFNRYYSNQLKIRDDLDLINSSRQVLVNSLEKMNNGANKILKKALDLQRLTSEEAIKLFHLEDEELDHLYRVADFIRNKKIGNNVTYVVNRNINFTFS